MREIGKEVLGEGGAEIEARLSERENGEAALKLTHDFEMICCKQPTGVNTTNGRDCDRLIELNPTTEISPHVCS